MNYVLAIFGTWVVFIVLKMLRRAVLARSHIAFSVNVADGDLEEATFYFRRLLAWSPAQFGRNPTIMLAIFNVRFLESSLPTERLLNYFESLTSEALAEAPTSPYPYLMAAGLASQRYPGGDTCRDYLAQALSTSGSNLEIYRRAGDIQLDAGMYREAEHYYLTLKHIAAVGRDEKGVLVANSALLNLYSQIEALAPHSGHSRTLEYADLVLASESDNMDSAKVYLLKANEYARYGNYPRAVAILREAFSYCTAGGIKPGAVLVFHPLITALLRDGQIESAEQIVNLAAEIGLFNLDVERARIAWHKNNPEEARKLLRGAIESGDGSVLNMARVAMAYRECDNLNMATAILEQALRQPPDSSVTCGNLCNPDVNIYVLSRVIFMPYENNLYGTMSIGSELASYYYEQGRFDECAQEWRRLALKDKHNPILSVFWGQALAKAGQVKEATKLFRSAEKRLTHLLEQAPASPLFNYAMAIICHHDGDIMTAAFHYSMVVGVTYEKAASMALANIAQQDGYDAEAVASRVLAVEVDSEARTRVATYRAVHSKINAEDNKSVDTDTKK